MSDSGQDTVRQAVYLTGDDWRDVQRVLLASIWSLEMTIEEKGIIRRCEGTKHLVDQLNRVKDLALQIHQQLEKYQ